MGQMASIKPVVAWSRLVVRMSFFAITLLWPAGTLYWWEAWVVIALWGLYGIVMVPYLLKKDPGLLAERLKLVPINREQKSWDKIIMALFFVMGVALYVVPGFDVVRFGWSDPLPLWMKISAMLLHLPCFMLLGWIMHENTYLSQVVKIDLDREHKVITTGPYARVRHPMYTVVIVLLVAVPVALGSRYALVPAVLLILLLIVRTVLEDRTLRRELDGYEEYTTRTPSRLFPGVW